MEKGVQSSLFNDIDCEQLVSTEYRKRKKRSKIEINIDGALMELNFLLLPLMMVGKSKKFEDVGTVRVTWLDGKNRLRGVQISVPDGMEMINSYDFKVFVALMKLYSEENNVIPLNPKTQKYDIPIEIPYTIRGVAKKMGINRIGGSANKKIKDSIRKWNGLTVTSLGIGAIYDSENQKHIEKSEKGFHIIGNYEMYERTKVEEGDRIKPTEVKDYNKVVIDSFFYSNLCNGYFKIIQYDMFMMLKKDVSMRLFALCEGLYASKRPYQFFKYSTLYARINFHPDMETKEKNRQIKSGCEELKSVGYAHNYIVVPRKGIYLIFDKEYDSIQAIQDNYLGLNKYSEIKDIVTALSDYQLEDDEIANYLKAQDIEYIKALLRYVDMKVATDSIIKDKPYNLLKKGLDHKYDLDHKYYNIPPK